MKIAEKLKYSANTINCKVTELKKAHILIPCEERGQFILHPLFRCCIPNLTIDKLYCYTENNDNDLFVSYSVQSKFGDRPYKMKLRVRNHSIEDYEIVKEER